MIKLTVGPIWAESLKHCECDKSKPATERCTDFGVARCAAVWDEYARRMIKAAEDQAVTEVLPS